jgi:hypothetical protein
MGVCVADEYRSAGVIYGNLANKVKGAKKQQEWSRKMMTAWKEYVRRKPEDKEIGNIVQLNVNPYTGQQVS